MNEMYNMSIVMHDFGVLALVIAVLVNIVMLQHAFERKKYRRKMRIYMPFSVMSLAAIMFTGTVMMAAKHLAFTLENVVMIIISIVLIVLESRRYRGLKYMDRSRNDAFGLYRIKAMKIMGAELFLVILVSIWMLLL
jgi:hypothetical protein